MFLEAVKKYAVFSGRARRKEYWMFALLYLIASVAGSAIDVIVGTFDPIAGIGVFSVLVTLGLLLPSIGVLVRRLHDTNRSGWWALILFIPLFGAIAILVFMCLDGTNGENRFGSDPKATERLPPSTS